ncbi:hypothetical protein [Clostridium senegalense]|uniref:hypothetical protein n=1 Tax=Clostridium senegalense TaxID=1465809 RepID=UPI000288A044|nr:hypothetical protein [Clostridium senegalense]MBU5226199.1 hypothetical protein [Clostridium senegalense]
MSHRSVIDEYYKDITNLTTLLNSTSNAYRLLVASANDYNNMALAKKAEVKDALKRSNELGKVIDNIIDSLDYTVKCYNRYMNTKSDAIGQISNSTFVGIELENQLKRTE